MFDPIRKIVKNLDHRKKQVFIQRYSNDVKIERAKNILPMKDINQLQLKILAVMLKNPHFEEILNREVN